MLSRSDKRSVLGTCSGALMTSRFPGSNKVPAVMVGEGISSVPKDQEEGGGREEGNGLMKPGASFHHPLITQHTQHSAAYKGCDNARKLVTQRTM